MSQKETNINSKEVSSLFTGRELYKFLVRERNNEYYDNIKKYAECSELFNKTFKDIIRKIYRKVYPHYRNEYFFKNMLANKLYIKNSNLYPTTYLSEYPVGKSVADVIMVNHISRVFEIKTELDTPERLDDQLADYRKLFEELYVVTYETLREKYLKILPDDVGLYVATNRSALKLIKKARHNAALETDAMISFLRMSEMENIIQQTYSTLPVYKPIRKYRAYRLLLNLLPFNEFQTLWKEQVSQRVCLDNLELLKDGTIPCELSHWYLTKIKTKKEAEKLRLNLFKTVKNSEKLCTSHI